MSLVRIAVSCQGRGKAQLEEKQQLTGSKNSSPKNGVKGFRCNMTCRNWMAPLAVLCVWALGCCASYLWTGLETPFPESRRVLLVTAHPDDETIFFSPTISSLHSGGKEVFLLCLSTGNAHGLGETRTKELQKAAAALKIDADHLEILDHPQLQDGKQSEWEPSVVAGVVSARQRKHDIDTIVTFDDAGITQHSNHLSVHAGVRHLIESCEAQEGGPACPTAWELVTTDKATGGRKMQMSVLQSLRLAARSGNDIRRATHAGYVNHNLLRTFAAMFAHQSQSRWWAHLLTMRYTAVNVYRRMTSAVA